MGKFINPEYKVVNDTNYVPFEYKTTGKGNSSFTGGAEKALGIVENSDGSNGVSLYNDTELIVKTTFSDNVELNYDSDLKALDILINPTNDLKAGTGIKITKDYSDDKKVIKIDEDYLDTFVKDRCSTEFLGENGILVEDNEENGKIIKLDDDYIIRQGEY